MSVITVQLGQCGNQIGCSLFSNIYNECFNHSGKSFADFSNKCSEMFFNYSHEKKDGSLSCTARSVLVDSEHKVISQVINCSKKFGTWSYDPGSQICYKRGSGNNWAQGYCIYGPQMEESFGEVIRMQVENCDRLSGFLMLMSLAGGTGSGAGAFLTNHLRDHYPHSVLVNQTVWPYSSGEVAVQNYNAVLSMSHVYQSTDTVIAFDNDSLHKICTNQLSIQKVSFSDLNKVLSKQLSFALLPSSSHLSPLNDIATMLTPHPEYKLVSMVMAPMIGDEVLDFTTYHWPAVVKNLQRQVNHKIDPVKFDLEWQLRYSFDLRKDKSFANLLVCRGTATNELDEHYLRTQCFQRNSHPLYNEGCFNIRTHSKPFGKMDKSAIMMSNDCSQMMQLDRVVDRAWSMFTSRASLHQYRKYGLEDDDFVDCFVTLEQLLNSYANM